MRTRYIRPSWRKICAGAVLAALTWTSAQAGTPTPFAPPTNADLVLYRDAILIDGTGAPARPHMDVLVSGERILSVFSDATRPAETKAKVVDLHGKYLMPGLIDSHVHLATPPNRRQAEAMLRRDLYGGVTAVRDMADDLRAIGDIARASRVGEIAASDVYYAALMAGPDFFNDPRTAQTTAGGEPGQVPWMQAVTDQTDLPLAVARAAGTSATAIKLYADLDSVLAGRITAEAHRQHLLVWSHATLYPAKPSEVVTAGVDAISHACLLVRETDPQAPQWAQPRHPVDLDTFRAGDNPVLARLFAVMVARGTILDATVWTYGAAPPAGPSSTPPLKPGSCDDVVGGAITRQAYRAGVQISAGTDNVAPATDPWPDLFHELSALVDRAGAPPSAVIRSATLVGARAAGQERDMGSLEPGKLANMIVLSKDPLASIDNLKTVVMTVKRGRVFTRDDFVPLREDDITDF
ncbi:amidohydrolase family protein [Caulobacter sp. RL271]|uniref:Amidohydrolase family protein n=1 Tax=Caulobacter segnis TaxID=88688 RepID=A0ABY4ZPN6_9CAUL|nr:amidohydrolase family protein [Caulobacter segnis]USQ94169.1 amidohydrolase family protein [Caulobacter segnis]